MSKPLRTDYVQYIGDKGLNLFPIIPNPVRSYIPSDKKAEPADRVTIAVIKLRRQEKMFRPNKEDANMRFLNTMWYTSQKRRLTNEEAEKVLGLLK